MYNAGVPYERSFYPTCADTFFLLSRAIGNYGRNKFLKKGHRSRWAASRLPCRRVFRQQPSFRYAGASGCRMVRLYLDISERAITQTASCNFKISFHAHADFGRPCVRKRRRKRSGAIAVGGAGRSFGNGRCNCKNERNVGRTPSSQIYGGWELKNGIPVSLMSNESARYRRVNMRWIIQVTGELIFLQFSVLLLQSLFYSPKFVYTS